MWLPASYFLAVLEGTSVGVMPSDLQGRGGVIRAIVELARDIGAERALLLDCVGVFAGVCRGECASGRRAPARTRKACLVTVAVLCCPALRPFRTTKTIPTTLPATKPTTKSTSNARPFATTRTPNASTARPSRRRCESLALRPLSTTTTAVLRLSTARSGPISLSIGGSVRLVCARCRFSFLDSVAQVRR